MPRPLLLSSPYPETGLLALANASYTTGRTTRLFIRDPRIPFLAPLSKAPLVGERLKRVLDRRLALPDLEEALSYVSSPLEILRFLSRGVPSAAALSSRLMYRGQVDFDKRVADRLSSASGPVTAVTMPGAGCHTQRALPDGSFAVVHMVNSHPRVQNRLLERHAGLYGKHHERVDEQTIARIDRELERADLILAPTAFVRRGLVAEGCEPGKIAVQPYGASSSSDITADITERESDLVLFVGQISYRKGVHLIGSYARRMPDVRFVLVGPMVTAKVLSSMPSNVSYIGSRSSTEVNRLMHVATTLLLPSIEDACPLVVYEALACGCPVVLSDNCGNAEDVVASLAGLSFTVDDPALAVASLRRVIDDPIYAKNALDARASRSWNEFTSAVLARLP